MNIPTALYDAPTTVPLGFMAGVAILVVAGVIAWKAGSAGLQQKLRTMLVAIGVVTTGLIALGTTTHLLLVQLSTDSTELQSVSVAAVSLHVVVMLALVAALITAVIKRMPIGTASAACLLAMSLATFAELNQYRVLGGLDDEAWALGAMAGYAGVVITGLALVVTASVKLIQAYGHKQFQLGQQAALDASQQQDKMSLNS